MDNNDFTIDENASLSHTIRFGVTLDNQEACKQFTYYAVKVIDVKINGVQDLTFFEDPILVQHEQS